MKNEKAENSKIDKSEPRRVAGVPVRSGVKAGTAGGLHELGGPKGPRDPGGLFGPNV